MCTPIHRHIATQARIHSTFTYTCTHKYYIHSTTTSIDRYSHHIHLCTQHMGGIRPTHTFIHVHATCPHTHNTHTYMRMHTLIQLQPCSLNVHILFIKACPHSLHLILGLHITSLPPLFFLEFFLSSFFSTLYPSSSPCLPLPPLFSRTTPLSPVLSPSSLSFFGSVTYILLEASSR